MRFLLLAVFFMAVPVTAFAEELSIGIPIRVVIIQCGTQQEAHESCESGEEQRCCPVVDPALLEEERISAEQNEREPISIAQTGTAF